MDLNSIISALRGANYPMPFGVSGPAEPAVGPPQFVVNALNNVAKIAAVPGEVYQSATPITSDQLIKPATDLAGITTFGASALPAEADVVDAIRSGAMKAAPLHQLHDAVDFTDKYKLLKPSPQQGQMPSSSPQWFL